MKKVKDSSTNPFSSFVPKMKEEKTAVVFVKVTPSVKEKLLAICRKNHVSQGELIAYWVDKVSEASDIS